MLKTYDAQEEARLISVADSKEKERVECATKIQDMISAGESKSWDNEQHLEFRQIKEKHDWLRDEIASINSDVKAMQATKPIENADKVNKNDPMGRWIRKRAKGLDSHELKDQEEYADSMNMGDRNCYIDPIFRAAVVPAANPNVIDETTLQEVIRGLDAYGGALDCFTVAMTPNGNTINYPLYDDVSGTTRRVAATETGTKAAQEGASQQETALNGFGEVSLGAWVRNTDYLDISRFFNEDVNWDVGAFVRSTLMNRMGRTIEEELTNGGIAATGTKTRGVTLGSRTVNVEQIGGANATPAAGEAQGFVLKAGQMNYTSPSTAKDLIKWQDLQSLIYSIPNAYLRGEKGLYGFPHKPGKVGFMTSWEFLGAIKNLSDSQNRPLVLPSLQSGGAETLFNYPIFINDDLVDTSFGGQWHRPIYFGNWSYMTVRFSGAGFAIEEHYDSNTAPSNTSRFLGRIRYDSNYIGVLNSNRAPAIKALVRHVA